jgi:hypothetical protein
MQPTFSPLQGTTCLRQTTTLERATTIIRARTMKPLPSAAEQLHGLQGTCDFQSLNKEHVGIISEMENLAIDTHGHWLDSFTLSPLAGLVFTAPAPGEKAQHPMMLSNTSCVVLLGLDRDAIINKSLEELLSVSETTLNSLREGLEKEIEFAVPSCRVQTAYKHIICTLVVFPITDVCTAASKVQSFMALLLDDAAVFQCKDVLKTIPHPHDLRSGKVERMRKGLFGGATSDRPMGVPTAKPYSQARSLQVAFTEACQRRMLGMSASSRLPSVFDGGSWLTLFETLLTVPCNQDCDHGAIANDGTARF